MNIIFGNLFENDCGTLMVVNPQNEKELNDKELNLNDTYQRFKWAQALGGIGSNNVVMYNFQKTIVYKIKETLINKSILDIIIDQI